MKLNDLDGLNFGIIPTDVLKILRGKINQELGARAVGNKISGKAAKPISMDRTWSEQIDKKGNKRKTTVRLQELLMEDWSGLFNGSSERRFYVYAHVDPGAPKLHFHCQTSLLFNGRPFYIGKGTGDRAYDLKRNQGHGATLSELLSHGRNPSEIVQIMSDNLTEAEALELESKLIYFFGTKYERHRDGILVNLDIPKIPSQRNPQERMK